jgi:MFS family permease
MYALTRSPMAVGMIGVVEFVPTVVMALIGGALADRLDRRRLIGFVEAAMALCCAVLAWNAFLTAPHGRCGSWQLCSPRSTGCTGPPWRR